jgi:TM2 domain-containing membrane protein YozV
MNFDQIVNGIPLLFVVMGLVELSKSFGAQGKALTAISFGIGLIIGLLYQLSLGMPADYAGWFGAAVFGLALGLVASKVYDAIASASGKHEAKG